MNQMSWGIPITKPFTTWSRELIEDMNKSGYYFFYEEDEFLHRQPFIDPRFVYYSDFNKDWTPVVDIPLCIGDKTKHDWKDYKWNGNPTSIKLSHCKFCHCLRDYRTGGTLYFKHVGKSHFPFPEPDPIESLLWVALDDKG